MNEKVAAIFNSIRRRHEAKLRQLIFETAERTNGAGELEETLKWNQPSYLTPVTKSGTTIRIDSVKNISADYAMYFNCRTTLVDSFRLMFRGTFRYEGNRAILFRNDDEVPVEAVCECIAMALTYHLKR
jgi:hypothetical protein